MAQPCCPSCGRPLTAAPSALIDMVETVEMPRREYQVCRAMLGAWPRFVSGVALVEFVYGERDDHIRAPEQVIWSHLSKLRTRIKPHGWTVERRRNLGVQFQQVAA